MTHGRDRMTIRLLPRARGNAPPADLSRIVSTISGAMRRATAGAYEVAIIAREEVDVSQCSRCEWWGEHWDIEWPDDARDCQNCGRTREEVGKGPPV